VFQNLLDDIVPLTTYDFDRGSVGGHDCRGCCTPRDARDDMSWADRTESNDQSTIFLTKKKHATKRLCGKLGRDKCNECDETKYNADNCDVLTQKQRGEEKLKKARSDDRHDPDGVNGDSESG